MIRTGAVALAAMGALVTSCGGSEELQATPPPSSASTTAPAAPTTSGSALTRSGAGEQTDGEGRPCSPDAGTGTVGTVRSVALDEKYPLYVSVPGRGEFVIDTRGPREMFRALDTVAFEELDLQTRQRRGVGTDAVLLCP